MANLKQAFEYASQNPNSDFSKNLEKLASSGSLDAEAKKYSIDLSPFQQKKTLVDELGERAKTFASEVTLKPSRDILTSGVDTIGQQRELTAMESGLRAAQSPIRAVGAVGGAIGDVVGAGLEATGIDKVIGGAIAPLAQSQPAQKAIDLYKSLPQETQDVLGAILNTANIPVGGAGVGIAKSGIENGLNAVKTLVPKNLSQKAVDLISSDPGAKVETILKRSSAQDLDNYLNIAKNSAVSGEAKTVFEAVGDKLADTTKILGTKLGEIGKAKSDIVSSLREGLGSFKNETNPFIEKLTSLKNSFSEIDGANKGKVQAIINDAKTISTKRDADAFIDKVQDALYTGNIDMTIPRGSSLDKQLRGILGEYNSSLKNSLPKEYAQLNEQYSKLIDSLDTVNRSLGEVVEGVPVRGASLIKQYFSPSGSKAKEIFDFIKKETNGEVDLAKDATLAKFAGQLYDDPNVNSLLGGVKDIPTTLGAITGRIVEKVGGEKITEAMRASTIRKAKGKSSQVLESKSGIETKPPVELKVSPSPNTTPTPTKSKGIRGMVNPSELVPKKAVGKIDGIPVNTDGTLTMYRTSKSGVKHDPIKDFTYFSPDKTHIEQYLRGGDKVIEYKIKPEDLISDGTGEYRYLQGQGNLVPKKKVPTLEQEAKKYKSAEEFVKAQKENYHLTISKFDKFNPNEEGIFFTDSTGKNRILADRGERNVMTRYLETNNPFEFTKENIQKLIEDKDLNSSIKEMYLQNNNPIETFIRKYNESHPRERALLKKYLEKNGYDSIIIPQDKFLTGDYDLKSVVVFKPEQIKTRKDLIDIWNKK